MTEDEIIDVFDNIACCKRAHDKDHEYRTSYQVQDPLHLAFKRLQCKLRKPQGKPLHTLQQNIAQNKIQKLQRGLLNICTC